MREILVNASKKYTVTVTDDWNCLGGIIKDVAKGKKIGIITDKNVEPLYLQQVKSVISSEYDVHTITIESGEQSKDIKTYAILLNVLARKKFTREDTLIALGGGVVGDLTAFVASTYMRGINLISVPTTLLSMIDSSVGGKTAINLDLGKNLCGTFYQPNAVYVNVNALKTLPEKEIKCGQGELVKYAILSDKITENDVVNYNSIDTISKCIEIKKDIVEQDEFEGGKRALLNLGHTYGHALEALSKYKISHGECVLQGLYIVLDVSKKLYNLSQTTVDKILNLLNKVDERKNYDYSIDEILKQIAVDKKASFNGVKLVAIKDVGQVEICPIEIEKLRSYLG